MNAETWQQVDELFQVAVTLDPIERAAFLDSACSRDPRLRSEVESLLSADSLRWDLLERPVVESAAFLLSDDEPRLSPGRHVGHYEIMELLGRGGMGEVYVARDKILNRKVALKLLPSDYIRDEGRLRRFKREAETVSALNHPNIITIHELGGAGELEFIVTELIDGDNLRERMKRGPLPLQESLDIAIQTATALAAAHRAGIVHRDIKPENIMVRPDGLVKVLDFGLAKLSQKVDVDPNLHGAVDPALSSDLLMGTLRYMSPEQATGAAIDTRTDIFSLGVVLYEMISGESPFTHHDLTEPFSRQTPRPLGTQTQAASPMLDSVIAKMIRGDRFERYQTVEDLITDLKAIKESVSVATPATELPTSGHDSTIDGGRRIPISASIAVLVTVVVMFIGYALVVFFRDAGGAAAESTSVNRGGTWAIKAPISSPRWQAAPAVLEDSLYAVGGWNVCSGFANLEKYDATNNRWEQRAPMHTARGAHGVGVIGGKIYAVGGSIDCGVHTASVEAYDPIDDTWTTVAPLPTERYNHVVAVANGKLYSIGGASNDTSYLSLNTEYDPETNSWTERAPMPTPRAAAAVVALDGMIYVIGGAGFGGTLSTVEVYNAATDSWTVRAPMLVPRVSFAASAANGNIFVFGGRGSRSQVETYDPISDTWSEVGRMPTAGTHFHAATLHGSIYLVGGSDGVNYTSNVLAFTPASNETTESVMCPTLQENPRASMPTRRSNMSIGLIDGIIYVVGGYENQAHYLSVNEAYDPSTDTWTTRASLPEPRETRGTNNAVIDGKLYVIGGNASGKCSAKNEVYDPVADRWSSKASMPTPRCHSAAVAANGLVYVLGGTNTNGSIQYNNAEVYNASSDSWSTIEPMPTARQDLGAAVINGVLYAVGGANPAVNPDDSELNILEAYDPVTKKWRTEPPMPTPRSVAGVGVVNGMLVVVGGQSKERPSGTVEIYDPKVRAWTTLTTTALERSFLTVVGFNDTLYAFGGSGPKDLDSSTATSDVISLAPCSN